MAGRFASCIKAKKLVMTHFSQRYRSSNDEIKKDEVSVDKLLQQAKNYFKGEVIAADDFTVINVPLPR